MTKDPQDHMDQRDPGDFRALVDLQVIQARRDFKAIRVSRVLLVLMVLRESLVLDSRVLRGKEARKEEQGLRGPLALVSRASQVSVVLREHQVRGVHPEKDSQEQRGIWDLWDPKDQWASLELGVKGNRVSKVLLVHLVLKDPQDKAHLVLREK